MATEIIEVTTPQQFAQFAALIADYFGWLRERYQDQAWLIDQVATAQSLDEELRGLSSQYLAPAGRAFLALVDGQPAAGGAWRRMADGSSEMKRVFVRPNFARLGLGRALCVTLMTSARDDGYRLMRLDTGRRMVEAQSLYRTLGFVPCPAYHDYPPAILAALDFMQAPL